MTGTTDDFALLQTFARSGSQEAFAQVVRAYVDLMHSSALRQVRDPGLAEDVTQAVFIILAQKAGKISPKTVLVGWLMNTTRYVAAGANRERLRREKHERRAAAMKTESATSSDATLFSEIAPHLDSALAALPAKDRDAVLLRYFQQHGFHDVAAAIGTTEDTAKRRVQRAIDKLRRILTRRDVNISGKSLAAMLPIHCIQPAPVMLTAHISTTAVTALTGAATAGSSTLLAKGALRMMYYAKLKLLGAAVAAALVITAATPILLLAQQNKPATPPPAAAIIAIPNLAPPAAPVSFPFPTIIAIGPNTPDNKIWWAPDGSSVDPKDIQPQRFAEMSAPGITPYDVLLRLPDGWKDGSIVFAGGVSSRFDNLLYISLAVPNGQTTGTFSLIVATGPWLVLGHAHGYAEVLMSDENTTALSGPSYQVGADTVKAFADNLGNMEHRFVALDKSGHTLATFAGDEAVGVGSNSMRLFTLRFLNMNMSDIAEIRCDVRPFDYRLDYRGIPLQPAGPKEFAITATKLPVDIPKNLKPLDPSATVPASGPQSNPSMP